VHRAILPRPYRQAKLIRYNWTVSSDALVVIDLPERIVAAPVGRQPRPAAGDQIVERIFPVPGELGTTVELLDLLSSSSALRPVGPRKWR
jgi:hypothetical protein